MADENMTDVSLALPFETVQAYNRLAELLEKEPAGLMRQALDQYLASTGRQALQDAQGLDELDRGDSAELDDVLDKARLIVEAADLRRRRAV